MKISDESLIWKAKAIDRKNRYLRGFDDLLEQLNFKCYVLKYSGTEKTSNNFLMRLPKLNFCQSNSIIDLLLRCITTFALNKRVAWKSKVYEGCMSVFFNYWTKFDLCKDRADHGGRHSIMDSTVAIYSAGPGSDLGNRDFYEVAELIDRSSLLRAECGQWNKLNSWSNPSSTSKWQSKKR